MLFGLSRSSRRSSVKPPHSKRWRADPASSNFANHLGLRRQPAELKLWRRSEHRGDGAFAWHERLRIDSRLTQSGVALRLPPHSMMRLQLPSAIKLREASGLRRVHRRFFRSAAVSQTSRSTSADTSRRFFHTSLTGMRCDWSCGHSRAPAYLCHDLPHPGPLPKEWECHRGSPVC